MLKSRQTLKMLWSKYIVPVMLPAIFAFAGCGGGTASKEAPTKGAFISEADAICRHADERQLSAIESYAKKHDLSGLTRARQASLAVAVELPAIRAEAKELRKLTPPDGEEDQVQAIVKGIEEAADEGEAHPFTMGTGPTNAFIEVNRLAKHYGFKGCVDTG
jgi:hypothetical protein